MRKLIVILSLVLGGLIVLAQRIGFPPVTNTTGGGGTNYTFNSGQFTIINSTNVNFKVGSVVTNLTDNGSFLVGTTNVAGALALKAPITSAALVTPAIGVATGTSLVLTNTLTVNGVPIAGIENFTVACSDETTALTAGTNKVTFRMPYAFTVTAVRANLTTAQASGSIFTVDINEAGTSILSTKITIDNTELTSTTAVTAPVISDSSLADDAQITVDIDQLGNGSATGLKICIIGHQ